MIVEYGTIQSDGSVFETDGRTHWLPIRGTDEEGYPEVLLDAKDVGGSGFFRAQSIKPFIGMKVSFVRVDKNSGPFNHTIV